MLMACNSYLSFTSFAVDEVQTLECCLALILERTKVNWLNLNLDNTEILFLGGGSPQIGCMRLPIGCMALSFHLVIKWIIWVCFWIQHCFGIPRLQSHLDQALLR